MTPLLIALVAALILVPAVRFVAVRINLVDRPDAERKLHSRPIALAGGVAVFTSMVIAVVASLGFNSGWTFESFASLLSTRWVVLIGCSIAILVIGLIDDAFTLRGRQKLLAQCLVAMVIVGSGTVLDRIGILGYEFPLGVFALPISVLWLLIAINALNLLDGADGMATTVGMFVAGSLGVVSLLSNSDPLSTSVALALCGALAGFLVFNRPPASIFLGDAGSMTVGLIVGVLAMWCSLKESTLVAAAPIAILVLPLFDSSAAIVRRWLTGRSIYATDRGHLHHLLNDKFGRVGTLWVVAAACSVSSAAAIASTYCNQHWLAPLGAIFVLAALISTRTFGYSELRLLAGRLRHLTKSFLMRPQLCDTEKHERSLKMQGDGPWQDVWEPLIDFAVKQDMASVKIDVNMAWLHQSYHATWRSVRLPEKAYQNVVRIPLFAQRGTGENLEHVPIGRLEVIAGVTPNALECLRDFLDHAAELQVQVESVVNQLESNAEGSPVKSSTKETVDENVFPERAVAGLIDNREAEALTNS